MRKIVLLLVLLVIVPVIAYSQQRPPNSPHYDDKLIHFGALVGYNTFSAMLKVKDPLPNPEKILGVNIQQQAGFQLGVIGDLRVFEYLRLRLLPTITFGDRRFNYDVINSQGKHLKESVNISAIYLEVPLELKIQSKRHRNFRPYLIAGLKYAYDLESLKKKDIPLEDLLVRVEPHDFLYTAGVGFDFYLPFSKIGFELKSSFSFNDLHIEEAAKPYSNIIDSYKTQIFYFTITVE